MKKLRSTVKSFYCAVRGIAFCLRHEQHFRVHIVATAYVMYFASFYDFSKSDYAILVLTCASVIFMELINTAVEVVIDKVSPKYNVFAMMGKDLAAGAVLFSAVGAVAVGIFMFFDIDVLIGIFEYFKSDILRLLILMMTIAVSVFFILSAKPRRTGNKKNKKS